MPFLIIIAAMAGAFVLAKRGSNVGANFAALPPQGAIQAPLTGSPPSAAPTPPPTVVATRPRSVSMPTTATPQVPDAQAGRQGSPAQTFFPSGFTSVRSPVTQASPQPSGATIAPSIKAGGFSAGSSIFERNVYTEVGVPMTPLGAYTRAPIIRAPLAPAKVTTPIGAAGAAAPPDQKPIVSPSPIKRAATRVTKTQRLR
jgi:hypothetical protein